MFASLRHYHYALRLHCTRDKLQSLTCPSPEQIGDQGHLYAGSSSSNGDSEASTSASAVVFIEDTHKAGGGALVVHHGRLESGDLHVGQMASCIPTSLSHDAQSFTHHGRL